MKRKKIAILPRINNCGGDLQKKWFIYFSYRDPRNDKMKRFKIYEGLHRIKDFTKRTEAAEKLNADYIFKLKNGWSPFLDDEKSIYEDQLQYNNIARIFGKMRSDNRTIRYYATQLLNKKAAGEKNEKETISTYRSSLRVFNCWLEKEGIAENDISTFDNQIILQFFDFLINSEKLSKQTIRRYRQLLNGMFEIAKKEKAINENPVYDIPDCNRINDHSPRPISEFDIMTFKEIIMKEDPQLWMAICFEYYCFLRPGKELRFLKIKDIDFARGIIDVDAIRAKTNMERFPTIPVVFLRELREVYQLHKQPQNFYVFGTEGKPGLKHLGKNNLRFRFREFREKLNMPESYKFYSWKHTGNGRASDAGIPISEIQIQNGHTSIKTTEIYLRHKIGQVSKEIRNNFPPI